jgi:nitrite reductase/ring-hydroxylating ferredoxin subunit
MANGNIDAHMHIPFALTDHERIPTPRYYDKAFAKLEHDRLWPHVWQMACRLEQINELGDWMEYANLGKSVIIVRTKEGVKAFHNACRHRGVQLAAGHGNCHGKGFICPFHGWRWNMDGKNTFVYGRHMFSEHQLDDVDLALKPCRVELWGGCAFINFDDNALPLRDCIGPRGVQLEKYQIDELRAEWWYATVLPANWKTAMESFMEGYHVMRTHPQLHAASGATFNAMYGQEGGIYGNLVDVNAGVRENIQSQFRLMELLTEGMAGMCHAKDLETARSLLDVDLPEDPAAAMMAWYGMLMQRVTADGRARGEPTPDLAALAATDPLRGVEYIFPHYLLLPHLSSFAAYRVRPLGPETCLFELWSLTLFPEGKAPEPPMEPVMLPYDSKAFPPIPQQDYDNIPRQQIGLHAQGCDFMRLSRDIEGLIANYHQLVDGFLQGADREALRDGMNALVGGFDGPVRSLLQIT